MAVCTAPEEIRAKYSMESGSLDYSRYCNSACQPADTTLNLVCTDADPDAAPTLPASPSVPTAPTVKAMANAVGRAPAEQAMTQTGLAVKSAQPNFVIGAADLPLAKGDMIQAMIHAKAAGEAARIAKESYERILRSSRQMAEAAGKATLNEIKREAGEQAKQALLIRLNYESTAKTNAANAAIAAAMPYKQALNRDAVLAGTWQIRSGEFARAAADRKSFALAQAADAERLRKLSEWDLARDRILQAHQAMDQAQAYAGSAESAHKQAVSINNNIKWYIYAEQAAAANMLAKSMPPDVPPPAMPPLP